MTYKQTVKFDVAKMGKKPGYCLQNVRLGFGIPPKYYDAKAAMEACDKEGTLHPIDSLPTDVAVPVFIDTTSPNEHVIAADHGVFYSDGKRLTSLKGLKVFGWTETLNDVRVVEYAEPTPAPESVEDELKEGDIVVPIELVDYNGTKLKQYDEKYTVLQHIPGSDRVVLGARGQIWAALKTDNVRRV